MTWASGDDYQARFDRLAAQGHDVHGEADLVSWYEPATVLDAGCGSGRVAVELARRGVHVVGVDVDESMLATARRRAPDLDWRRGDLATADLEPDHYDLVVMAGNVLLFTAPGTEAAVVANLAGALRPGGRLVSGFSLLPGRYTLAEYDEACTDAGLVLEDRWSTWDRQRFTGGDYAVSVSRRDRGR